MAKTCTKCGLEKSLDEFNAGPNKDGKRQPCRECQNEQGKAFYAANREKIIEWQHIFNRTEHRMAYARKYQKAYARKMRDLAASRPRPLLCEACSNPGDERGIVWDHDHGTGAFRGWLCNRCNRVAGMCGDSSRVLQHLADYLEEKGHAGKKGTRRRETRNAPLQSWGITQWL